MLILVFGMGAFGSAQFWLSLYLQTAENLSALDVAVRLLPQAIGGVVVNVSIYDLSNIHSMQFLVTSRADTVLTDYCCPNPA
jgi:hypothetical protein